MLVQAGLGVSVRAVFNLYLKTFIEFIWIIWGRACSLSELSLG